MPFVSPPQEKPKSTHQLDPVRIIETADNLAETIGQSLPDSTLAGLAVVLARLARETGQRLYQARRPILAIRLVSAAAVGSSLLGLWYLVHHIRNALGVQYGWRTLRSHRRRLQSSGSCRRDSLVLHHARVPAQAKKVLEFIQEMREFVHVIDVTQLYYTPELYQTDAPGPRPAGKFDHRYLLYCTQMLGVISNLTALYTRGAVGDSIIRAAFDVEMLANASTAKLLSKAETLRLR